GRVEDDRRLEVAAVGRGVDGATTRRGPGNRQRAAGRVGRRDAEVVRGAGSDRRVAAGVAVGGAEASDERRALRPGGSGEVDEASGRAPTIAPVGLTTRRTGRQIATAVVVGAEVVDVRLEDAALGRIAIGPGRVERISGGTGL